jgi:hypothetical protein
VLSLGLGAASAFGCSGTHKITLDVRQSAEHRQHQAPGAGAGVGPRLGQGSELRLGVHDALDDAEQVKGAARQPVGPRHRNHVAGGQLAEHPVKLAPVAVRACHLFAVDVPATASCRAKLLKLAVERLPIGRDAGIADKAFFKVSFGHILCKP